MSMKKIIIEVPAEDVHKMEQALTVAAEKAVEWAENCPLRTREPETQRYRWFGVAQSIKRGVNSLGK